jgi:hypothetical protein
VARCRFGVTRSAFIRRERRGHDPLPQRRLVNVGMTASEVTERCGDPNSRTVEEVPVLARLPTGAVRQTGTTHAERWIYGRGQGQMDALLTFEDGKLRRIELVTQP